MFVFLNTTRTRLDVSESSAETTQHYLFIYFNIEMILEIIVPEAAVGIGMCFKTNIHHFNLEQFVFSINEVCRLIMNHYIYVGVYYIL